MHISRLIVGMTWGYAYSKLLSLSEFSSSEISLSEFSLSDLSEEISIASIIYLVISFLWQGIYVLLKTPEDNSFYLF